MEIFIITILILLWMFTGMVVFSILHYYKMADLGKNKDTDEVALFCFMLFWPIYVIGFIMAFIWGCFEQFVIKRWVNFMYDYEETWKNDKSGRG